MGIKKISCPERAQRLCFVRSDKPVSRSGPKNKETPDTWIQPSPGGKLGDSIFPSLIVRLGDQPRVRERLQTQFSDNSLFRRTTMHKFIQTAAAIFAVLLFTVAPAIAEDVQPSGTLEIKDTQFGFIVSGDVGHGTLNYDGKKILFHVHGGKIGGMGIAGMTLVGDVYRLNRLEDFAGLYGEVEAGLTVVKGKGGLWLKNDKGVQLNLRVKESRGLQLSIGVEGLNISL
jgi:hypothetical protein